MGTSDSSAGYSVETVATNADVFATPEISYIIDDVGLHTGQVTDGGKTDDKQPELHGTGEPGSVVTVTMYGPSTGKTYTLGHVTVGNDGTWSYQFTGKQGLQSGNNVFHVTTTDTDGHTLTGDSYTVALTGSNADDNTPPDITPPDTPNIYAAQETNDDGTQHGVKSGGTTEDSTPELLGAAEPDSIVTIYDGAVVIGSVAADSEGNWTYDVSQALADGKHTFTVTATDAAGNTSDHSPSYIVDVETADITPPDAPVIENYHDDVGDYKGDFKSGTTTDDATPELKGHAEANSIVKVYEGSTLLGSTTAHDDGSWSFTPSARTDGSHTFTATATDAAGNVSAHSGNFVVNVDVPDTTPPEVPVFTNAYGTAEDGAKDGTGVSNGGTLHDTTPELAGVAEPGSVVKIYDGSVLIGSTTTGADHRWAFDVSGALSEGKHTFFATATDAAGNTSAHSGNFVVNVDVPDTTPPEVPVFTSAYGTAEDGTKDGTGASNGGTLHDTTPELAGVAEPGSVVKIYDGSVLIGSATTGADHRWAFDVSGALSEGKHTFFATATDAAGNTSAHSGNFVVNIDVPDITPPDAPTIIDFYDDAGDSKGHDINGGTTDDTTPTLNGQAEANSIVKVYEGSTLLGSTTAKADGSWSYTTPVRTDGKHDFTATATDAAGNVSAHSGDFVVNIDTAPVGVSGFEDFQQVDHPYDQFSSFTTDSGLKIESSVSNARWARFRLVDHPELDNTCILNQQFSLMTFTLPGAADTVSFYGNGQERESMTAKDRIHAYDAKGNEVAISISVKDATHAETTAHVVVGYHYTITPASGQHIASFTTEHLDVIDDVSWYSANAQHANLQSAMLTSPDAVEHHDILTLAQIDDSHKSTAAVDITDHVQNTLHLTLNDILSEAHPNLFVQDGKQQLAVTGDQGDVVELKVDDLAHNTWQDSGAVTAGGIQYEVYQHAGSDVELLVQHGLELHQVS
ncbi:hypothetical protein D6C13_24915 [Rahnella woolbedingensis]|uniref:Bacterial Ig-like domain-containing protein n=2 Tax=Rahnella woolbedingensis TaxID=1510574 RepID=A0A419N1R0_9GAMM|nr:hypothetical protein D6C13_24915 [Rahnella woolbedingensis]